MTEDAMTPTTASSTVDEADSKNLAFIWPGAILFCLCFVLWSMINTFWFDANVLKPMCDMGTQKLKSAFTGTSSGISFEHAIANLRDEQILYVLDRAAGDDVYTRWQDFSLLDRDLSTIPPTNPEAEEALGENAEIATSPSPLAASASNVYPVRRIGLRVLAEQYGVVFDGPYVDPGSARMRVMDVYYNTKGSEQRNEIGNQLRNSGNKAPHRVLPLDPYARVRITSESGCGRESRMGFQVEFWSLGDSLKPISSSEQMLLFRRSGSWYLPIRPVIVHAEPIEAARKIVDDLEAVTQIEKVVKSVASGMTLDGASGQLDRAEREAQTRLFSAVFEVLLSGDEADPPFSGNPKTYSIPYQERIGELSASLSSKLRYCRLFNGVNFAGWINFLVVFFVLGGAIYTLWAKPDEIESVERRVDALIAVLPMLGFAGTLYGMLLAFSSVGAGGSGAELISFIGISLDTTIIAVCGAIILSLILLSKLRG